MRAYQLWTRSWCDYEVTADAHFKPAIRSLFPEDWQGDNITLTPEIQLVPEPEGPRGQWGIAVRAEGRTLGYLDDADAQEWAAVVRRIVASGLVPTTTGRIWGNEYDGWDGLVFNTSVHIALGGANEALPSNEPPERPYTILPRAGIVQVTKEDEHFDTLRHKVPPSGRGPIFVTLHENVPTEGRAKPHAEVRIDDQRVGQLTPAMSQRFLPMIRHLNERGLMTACRGDITGSAVAAEVRIDGIKANEASGEILDGPPVTVPRLIPELADPLQYDISGQRELQRPLALARPRAASAPAEPLDGSVVRFDKGRGRYQYVAVRHETHWETTATGDWGSINEIMFWKDLASRVRTFHIAADWAPVSRYNQRIREHLAVVRFTIGGYYLAAVNIADDLSEEGDWYTTISSSLEDQLPLRDNTQWSEIARNGDNIQFVTSWAQLPT